MSAEAKKHAGMVDDNNEGEEVELFTCQSGGTSPSHCFLVCFVLVVNDKFYIFFPSIAVLHGV